MKGGGEGVTLLILCCCCILLIVGIAGGSYVAFGCDENKSDESNCFCGTEFCDEDSICDTSASDSKCVAKPTAPTGSTNPVITPCSSNPCGDNGTCNVSGTTHTCECTNNYTGDNCEVAPLPPDPCSTLLEADCVNGFKQPSGSDCNCLCKEGWSGPKCSTPQKYWTNKVYNASGSKIDNPSLIYHYNPKDDTYKWKCNSGYYGDPDSDNNCHTCAVSMIETFEKDSILETGVTVENTRPVLPSAPEGHNIIAAFLSSLPTEDQVRHALTLGLTDPTSPWLGHANDEETLTKDEKIKKIEEIVQSYAYSKIGSTSASECLSYDPYADDVVTNCSGSSSRCFNGGKCISDHSGTSGTSSKCICPLSYYGNFCQFESKSPDQPVSPETLYYNASCDETCNGSSCTPSICQITGDVNTCNASNCIPFSPDKYDNVNTPNFCDSDFSCFDNIDSKDKIYLGSSPGKKICNKGFCDVDVINNREISLEDQKLGYYGGRYKLNDTNKIECNATNKGDGDGDDDKCINVPFDMTAEHCKANGDTKATLSDDGKCVCDDRIVGSLCHIKIDDLCGNGNDLQSSGINNINQHDDSLGGFFINASGEPEPRLQGSIYNVPIGKKPGNLHSGKYKCKCNESVNRKGEQFSGFQMNHITFCNAPKSDQETETGPTGHAPWITMYLPNMYENEPEIREKTLNNMYSYMDCGQKEFTNKGDVVSGPEIQTDGIRTGWYYSNPWGGSPTCKVCHGKGKNQIKVSEYYGFGTDTSFTDEEYITKIHDFDDLVNQRELINSDIGEYDEKIIQNQIPNTSYGSSEFGDICKPAYPKHYGTIGKVGENGQWESNGLGGESIIISNPPKPVPSDFVTFEKEKLVGMECSEYVNHVPSGQNENFAINSSCDVKRSDERVFDETLASIYNINEGSMPSTFDNLMNAARFSNPIAAAYSAFQPLPGAVYRTTGVHDSTTPKGDIKLTDFVWWHSDGLKSDQVDTQWNNLKVNAESICKNVYGFKKNSMTDEFDKYMLQSNDGGNTKTSCNIPGSCILPAATGVYAHVGLGRSEDCGNTNPLCSGNHGKAAIGCNWEKCPGGVCPAFNN